MNYHRHGWIKTRERMSQLCLVLEPATGRELWTPPHLEVDYGGRVLYVTLVLQEKFSITHLMTKTLASCSTPTPKN